MQNTVLLTFMKSPADISAKAEPLRDIGMGGEFSVFMKTSAPETDTNSTNAPSTPIDDQAQIDLPATIAAQDWDAPTLPQDISWLPDPNRVTPQTPLIVESQFHTEFTEMHPAIFGEGPPDILPDDPSQDRQSIPKATEIVFVQEGTRFAPAHDLEARQIVPPALSQMTAPGPHVMVSTQGNLVVKQPISTPVAGGFSPLRGNITGAITGGANGNVEENQSLPESAASVPANTGPAPLKTGSPNRNGIQPALLPLTLFPEPGQTKPNAPVTPILQLQTALETGPQPVNSNPNMAPVEVRAPEMAIRQREGAFASQPDAAHATEIQVHSPGTRHPTGVRSEARIENIGSEGLVKPSILTKELPALNQVKAPKPNDQGGTSLPTSNDRTMPIPSGNGTAPPVTPPLLNQPFISTAISPTATNQGPLGTIRPEMGVQSTPFQLKASAPIPANKTKILVPSPDAQAGSAIPQDGPSNSQISTMLSHSAPLQSFTPTDGALRHEPALAQHVATQVAKVAHPIPNGPVELALNPEELGRIRLTFSSENGGLSVVVATERPETLELMRRHIDALAHELRSIGYREVNIGFRQDGQNTGTTSQDQFAGSQEARPQPDNTDGEHPADATNETHPTMLRQTTSAHGVDLRL